ncbi:MAG: hypothetical protein ACREUR_04675 [Nitrosospira sp.]
MPRIKKPDPGADPGTGASGFYQDDFGGFNPRFAGVTIRIASQAAYDEFVSFLTTSPLPGDREEPLGPILMRSVMEHEIRHYHDFLLGSYNGILFRTRLQALLNGIEALHAAKELPGEVFPLPLGTWMTLPVEEREARLEEWAAFSRDGKRCTAIPVPAVSREALLQPSETGLYVTEDGDPATVFALAAEYAARGYARIQAVAQEARPGTQRRTQTAEAGETMQSPAHRNLINPANIQEVLALTVQLGAIWQAQGEQQARVFARFFLGECDLPSARLWRLLLDVSLRWTSGVTGHEDEWEKAFAASFQVMAIGTWTLLGSYVREGEAASPAARLVRLLSHLLADRAEANIASDVAATWDYWDSALVLNPWRESLRDSLDWAGRGVDFYADVQKASLPGWKKDFHATLHHMMKAYADDQRMLIEHVFEQPEDLVGVNRYLGLPAGILPTPLFRLQLDHSALDLGTLDQKVFEPVMTVDLDGTVAVLSCLLKMSTPMYRERAGDAVAFEYAAQLCDMAFSQQAPYGRSPLLQKRLLSDLEKTVHKTLRFLV